MKVVRNGGAHSLIEQMVARMRDRGVKHPPLSAIVEH